MWVLSQGAAPRVAAMQQTGRRSKKIQASDGERSVVVETENDRLDGLAGDLGEHGLHLLGHVRKMMPLLRIVLPDVDEHSPLTNLPLHCHRASSCTKRQDPCARVSWAPGGQGPSPLWHLDQ